MLSATGARRRAWLLAALLPAGVLVVDPRGYAPFGPLRWAVVSVVALLAVAVAGRGVRHVARWPAVAWTAFVVWVAVCAALGVDHRGAKSGAERVPLRERKERRDKPHRERAVGAGTDRCDLGPYPVGPLRWMRTAEGAEPARA